MPDANESAEALLDSGISTTGVAALLDPRDNDLFREVADSLPVPTLVLTRAGIVSFANRAACELLGVERSDLEEEPLLGWIKRPSEREAFGRAFLGMREQSSSGGFHVRLGLSTALGPPLQCAVTASRLRDGHVTLTLDPAPSRAGDAEVQVELGRAAARSLDALHQGVLMVDGEGRIVHANPAATELLGDGVAGRSFLELANPRAVDELTKALTVSRSGSWHGELELRRLDGEPLPAEVSMAVGTGEGAPGVVLLRDLRDRRRREFEDRLVAQVDRQLVVSAEPRDSVLAACSALATGLDAERVVILARVRGAWERWELRGETPQAPSPLDAGREPPSSWDEVRDVQLMDATDAETTRVFGPAERGRNLARIALRAPIGVVGHLLLVHRDPQPWGPRDRALIGLLASQIALGLANGLLTLETRALAAYQAMVLDQTSVMLNSVDAEGRVVTWNRASEQLLGTSVIDALGRKFGSEVAPTGGGVQWEALWNELLAEGTFSVELSLGSASGEDIPVHLEGRLLREADEVRGAVLVGLDLRDRRTLERQILRSQKLAAVGLLAAGIAHEINNPLSGVVGYSKLLLEQRLAPDVHARVQKIADSGERCRKIVEGVLLFSRRQEGGTRGPVDLGKLLESVLGIGEYQWRMHNIRIIRELRADVEVQADPDQIEQVLLNLLSNAVDAMPHGGTIRVALDTQPDGRAGLTVEDQGHGIPEEIQARIFDPFFSTKEIGKGTGLGLAISYGIVQDHGGEILLESKPGEGSRFTVILPPDGKPEGRASKEPAGADSDSDATDSQDDPTMESV